MFLDFQPPFLKCSSLRETAEETREPQDQLGSSISVYPTVQPQHPLSQPPAACLLLCIVLSSHPRLQNPLTSPGLPTCHLLPEDFLIPPASASAPSGSLSSLLCSHRSLLSYVVLILSVHLLYHTPHFMSLGLRFIYVGLPMGGG